MRAIRSDVRLAETKVIVASADQEIVQSLCTEADVSLLKPITFTQLRDLGRQLLPGECACTV